VWLEIKKLNRKLKAEGDLDKPHTKAHAASGNKRPSKQPDTVSGTIKGTQ
jgi:hypothetical protein